MSKTGLFIKLDVAYFEDEAILEVSEAAELLYVRALCKAMQLRTDGYLTLKQIERIAPLSGTRIAGDLARELVDHELWVTEGRGYRVSSWLDYNTPMKEVEAMADAEKEGGKFGNHMKWHVKRKKPNIKCQFCNPNIGSESPTDNVPDRLPESPPNPIDIDIDKDIDIDIDVKTLAVSKIETACVESPKGSHPETFKAELVALTSKKPRARDPIWDALQEIMPVDSSMTAIERGRCNKAAQLLRDRDATPDQILARGLEYRLRYPRAAFTWMALASHWGELASSQSDVDQNQVAAMRFAQQFNDGGRS